MRSLRLALVVVLVSTLAPVLARGQASGTSTILGTVTDPSGAVIAGATVTITDTGTKAAQSVTTNDVGRFIFSQIAPSTYDVSISKAGFQTLRVPGVSVITSQSATLNETLKVGAATTTVEVTSTPGAQLQTINSTMGTSLQGQLLLQIPSMDRDASTILYYQPTAAPRNGGAEGNYTAGMIAGQQSDQNTFLIDGANATDDWSGDNAYVNAFRAPIPTTMESTSEVQVNTNNATADFATATGGEVLVQTKRGTDAWHGSAYDFLQNSALDSNDWGNNRLHDKKPQSRYNRFGFSVGGPMLPRMLGGKTYFYFNYEALRNPTAGIFDKPVPLDTLRSGIIQEFDGTGKPVQYNLAPGSTANQCGLTGGLPCDPRTGPSGGMLGLDPVVANMWSTFMPEPNEMANGKCTGGGDLINTCGFRGTLPLPDNDNFLVGRIDHDFGPKLRWFGSYRFYKNYQPTTEQLDIGGLLPGDKKGVYAAASKDPREPIYYVTGLTATLTPTLTNDFHLSYSRNWWQWIRNGFAPNVAGVPGDVSIGGDTPNALIPVNVNTQGTRDRYWNGHEWDYRDTLGWVKGNHYFQFGGEWQHGWWHFKRYDDVLGGLTHLRYDVEGSGLLMTPPYQPLPCGSNGAAPQTNCMPGSEIGGWNQLYGEVLGTVDRASVVVTRHGSDLAPNPLGSPVPSFDIANTYSLYITDAFHFRPNWTFSYGLNWTYSPPPYDQSNVMQTITDAQGNELTADAYFANRLRAANAGQVYMPVIGFTPLGDVGAGTRNPFHPFYGELEPRASLAWSPKFENGFLGALFGSGKTVLRGGYARLYDRNQAVNIVSSTVLGDGFLQPISCGDPIAPGGACTKAKGTDPTNAFRIGTDGNVIPLPIAPTLAVPVEPGVNAPYVFSLAGDLDSAYRPGQEDEGDFSIQRELKGNMLLEVGWVGNWSKHLYQGEDLNAIPWMMKLNGQTFAQAYDGLYSQLASGATVTPQPWFEAALGGTSYCTGFSSCTAAVANGESGNFVGNPAPGSVWYDLDGNWNFGPTQLSTTQTLWPFVQTSNGYSNYQALVFSLQKRTGQGLTLSTNFTYSHALGVFGQNQEYTLFTVDNPWNLRYDYGPQFFNRKYVFNLLASYELPFGKGRRWSSGNGIVDRIIGGWIVAPVFYWDTGSPMGVFTGSFEEYGSGLFTEGSPQAIPLVNTRNLNNSAIQNQTQPSGSIYGINGNNTGNINMYSNPQAVFNSFKPCFVGVCTWANQAGSLIGQNRWNLDFSLNKTTNITERVKIEFFSEWFNALNHMQYGDPFNLLTDPQDFGVISGQYGTLGAGYTRVIQMGARVSF